MDSMTLLFPVLVALVMVASMWTIFSKAGQPGWMVLVPILNLLILLKIVNKPAWWIVLLFVPVANLIALVMVNIALAERFGHGVGFGLGLTVLPIVFMPMLAFGSSTSRQLA